MSRCLSDLRVLDFSSGIAGPYATKLFSDFGADVVKIESEDGDPRRRSAIYGEELGEADSAFFRYLHAGKRSVCGTADDPEIKGLIGASDLIVESGEQSGRVQSWRASHPHLVVLSLTPYGCSGPYSQRPATPFTVEAESGSLASRGLPDGTPFQVGGRLFEFVQGSFGSVGALAAVTRSRVTGLGEHVDCPLLLATNFSAVGGQETSNYLEGAPPRVASARSVEVPSIEPTCDGWVGVNTNTHQQFSDFLVMIGRSDLLEANPEWARHRFRFEHMDEWNKIVHSWTTTKTTSEILDLGRALRLPVAPVNNGKAILGFEPFTERGALGPSPDNDFIQPLPPTKLDGKRLTIQATAPRLGEHSGEVEWAPRPSSELSERQDLPFRGLRVLDATAFWAGPTVGNVFGCLGADVIHVESIQHPDGCRMAITNSQVGSSQWWERAALWLATNNNKRGLTLSLQDMRGAEIFDRLIAESDLVVENFSPRVFENFGITAERVRRLNPRAIFVRMPAFGLDGPWRNNVGFAQTMEQAAGLAWRTGHRNDQPRIPRGPCDPLGGYHALFAAIAALWRRSRSGEGAVLECTFVEAILNAAAEAVVTYSRYGIILDRDGNRSPEFSPQGLYRGAGYEDWVAISVATDEQWASLCRLMGGAAWCQTDELRQVAGRRAAVDMIDENLSLWVAKYDGPELVEQLLSVGVPAATLQDPGVCRSHPQFRWLGYFEEVDHPVAGRYVTPGMPFRYQSVVNWVNTPAPMLGQHNQEILGDVLGLSSDEVSELEGLRIIGSRPLGE